MESILVLGSSDHKLKVMLERVGHKALFFNGEGSLIDLIATSVVNLIVVDSRADFDMLELLRLLRGNSETRWVPIILLGGDEHLRPQIEEAGLSRIEFMQLPYTPAGLMTKIATHVRMRKLSGADGGQQMTVAEMNASLREMNARFAKELEESRGIQENLLPQSLPKDDRYEVCACYLPLEEVGGDLYFVEKQEGGKLLVQIADVTGHGLGAAFIGAMTKLALVASKQDNVSAMMESMNRLLTPQMPSGRFVTVATYIYDPASAKLEFARGGHPPGIHVRRATESAHEVKGDGFAIGFMDEGVYPAQHVELAVGDLFVVYSDALTESPNNSGAMWGSAGVSQALKRTPKQHSAEQILDSLLIDFKNYIEGQPLKDDVTVVVLKRTK